MYFFLFTGVYCRGGKVAGNCSAGYLCVGGQDRPDPPDSLCPYGFYCPEGRFYQPNFTPVHLSRSIFSYLIFWSYDLSSRWFSYCLITRYHHTPILPSTEVHWQDGSYECRRVWGLSGRKTMSRGSHLHPLLHWLLLSGWWCREPLPLPNPDLQRPGGG